MRGYNKPGGKNIYKNNIFSLWNKHKRIQSINKKTNSKRTIRRSKRNGTFKKKTRKRPKKTCSKTTTSNKQKIHSNFRHRKPI